MNNQTIDGDTITIILKLF
ncbi:hypothetical protein PFFVO_02600 [Plasmodium falciparum Vietnam Oak-Knoll (FVO)]|uniref:Uncharacterized protein n=1 Tax=Plasmodium falciparum Vietnam Oak-Knoll (FVO) TaxID=1036723 RepID=A0A024V8D5_PLAFA|nr:hypothetical protein PFFVO_02600 [Plasmodium falciparum Vietnam Oak-Knoll (FVO)]